MKWYLFSGFFGLWVEVCQQHALAQLPQRGGEVDGGGGFAGTAFLDGDGEGGHGGYN